MPKNARIPLMAEQLSEHARTEVGAYVTAHVKQETCQNTCQQRCQNMFQNVSQTFDRWCVKAQARFGARTGVRTSCQAAHIAFQGGDHSKQSNSLISPTMSSYSPALQGNDSWKPHQRLDQDCAVKWPKRLQFINNAVGIGMRWIWKTPCDRTQKRFMMFYEDSNYCAVAKF